MAGQRSQTERDILAIRKDLAKLVRLLESVTDLDPQRGVGSDTKIVKVQERGRS